MQMTLNNQRLMNADDSITASIMQNLTCRLMLNEETMQLLHMK